MKTTLKTITSGPPRGNGLHPHPPPVPGTPCFRWGQVLDLPLARAWRYELPNCWFFWGNPLGNLTKVAYWLPWHIFGKLLVENVHESCLLTMHFIFSRHFLFHAFSPQFGQQQTTTKKIYRLRGGQQQHSIFLLTAGPSGAVLLGFWCNYHLFLQLTWKPAFGTGFASELWWHQAPPKRFGDTEMVFTLSNLPPVFTPFSPWCPWVPPFRTEGTSGFRAFT